MPDGLKLSKINYSSLIASVLIFMHDNHETISTPCASSQTSRKGQNTPQTHLKCNKEYERELDNIIRWFYYKALINLCR